jgi:adenylosuccinate lyase
MQRDLSGSTVIRNQGVPLAHSLLACKNILVGLERLTVNRKNIREELNEHCEVLAEAIQTILRKTGDPQPYERLKKMTRGQKITREDIIEFVQSLNLPDNERNVLLNLSPENYTGLSARIVEEMS